MKIGILTHYNVINQGAILQMYAMQKWLEQHGHNVYILTYNKNFDFMPHEESKYNISIKYLSFYIREYLLKKGLFITLFNIKKRLMHKKYLYKTFSLKNYTVDLMDVVIVGSDEVFSITTGCNTMMFGHGVNSKRLVSYAPSFGQTDICRINQYNCKELIISGLQKFSHLSARDEKSIEIINELTGVKPQLVCDPVLLYDFTQEIVKAKIPIKKYLLIYSYDAHLSTSEEFSGIKKYAKSKGLITVSAGTYHKWCDKNLVCNPMVWLEYFRNAEQVFTDTYHGAILSIITNKPSVYFIRNLNKNKLTFLLHSLGLESRIAKCLTFDELNTIYSQSMDFSKVNIKWSKTRKQSEDYLYECINGKNIS